MSDEQVQSSAAVNTVLGPRAAEALGVVAPLEALLSVVPGAQYAPDISMDRAEIFAALEDKLRAFKTAGGGTIADVTGMFHGRDLRLLEALSAATGVHIVASTGMGPEENLGGYFLTPQTNPPTPWPAEKFAELFAKEVTEGMVIPRLERRAPAGLIVTEADQNSVTPTEESLITGAASAARDTGVAMVLRYGVNAVRELELALASGLPASRIVISGADRTDAVASAAPHAIAERGAFVAIDHIGSSHDQRHVGDDARVALISELINQGFIEQILLSSNAVGVAKGHAESEVDFAYLLTSFVPKLRLAGLTEEHIAVLIERNPRALLTVHDPTTVPNA